MTEEFRKEIARCSVRFSETQKNGNNVYVRGFMTLSSEDRQGDVIDPKLFDVATFMHNPQLWVNHGLWNDGKGNGIPVGVVEEMQPVKVSIIEGGSTFSLKKLEDDSDYRDNIPIDDFIVKDGNTGVWVVAQVQEPDVVKLVLDGRFNAFSWQGAIYRRKNGAMAKIDLYELSLVFVPAHQAALFQIGKSLTMHSMVTGTTVVIDTEAIHHLTEAKEGAVRITNLNDILGRGGVETKAAFGVHHTPVNKEADWDGAMATRNCRNEESTGYYAKVFAWRDPKGEAGSKATYKLPHHMVSDDGAPGAANIKGCIAAIAALNGARGGVDIPDADREGVYRHLAAHIKDAELEPPALKSIGDLDADDSEGKMKGGDDMELAEITKQLEAVQEALKLLPDLAKSVTGISERLDAAEKKIAATGEQKKTDDADAKKKVDADGDTKALDAVTELLKKINDSLGSVAALSDTVTKLEARLRAVEKAPTEKRNADDGDEKPLSADELREEVAKALGGLDATKRKSLERVALSRALVPETVGHVS